MHPRMVADALWQGRDGHDMGALVPEDRDSGTCSGRVACHTPPTMTADREHHVLLYVSAGCRAGQVVYLGVRPA